MVGRIWRIGREPKVIIWIGHERVNEEGGQLPVEVGGYHVPHLLGQGPVVGVEGRGKVEGGGELRSWSGVVWFAGVVRRVGLWSCVAV